jgi:hypothetical protein
MMSAKELETKQSKPTVEVLKDSGHCELTLQIINSNMGERLKKLDLNFQNKHGWFQTILPAFNNMPVLEELTLKSFNATVLNLEKLHTNLPTIKSLTLHNVRPCVSAIPENITPATLTKLIYRSDEYEDEDALPIWYQYMSRKYTNITQFIHLDYSLESISIDMAQQMYENGFLQFLQLIGPYTAHQVLYRVPNGINVFEALDNRNSKTKAFTFYGCQGGILFGFLAQSNQARYVEEIKLYKTEIGTLDSLQCLTSLTQIELYIDDDLDKAEIDFTNYLNAFPPSLERCDVTFSCLLVDPESTRSSGIKHLGIECEKLTKELGHNIQAILIMVQISQLV